MKMWKLTVIAWVVCVAAAAPAGAQTATQTTDPTESHWFASGYLGTNFGTEAADGPWNIGGTIGFLGAGIFGGEFAADFSPKFIEDSPFIGDTQINTWMGNAIVAVPIGGDTGMWQPFVSGGLGAMALRSDALQIGDEREDFVDEADETQLATNIGVGVMAFAGAWGFRSDLRFFNGLNSSDEDEIDPEDPGILDGVEFWRFNAGVAVRW
jgi:hypothetical protein